MFYSVINAFLTSIFSVTNVGGHGVNMPSASLNNFTSFPPTAASPGHLIPSTSTSRHFDFSHLISLCNRTPNIMSKLLTDSGPFLFPCTIEYSLICAAVLFVMWKNISEEHEHYKFQKKKSKISEVRL